MQWILIQSSIYFRCSYESHLNSETLDWNRDPDRIKLFSLEDETLDSIGCLDYDFVLTENKSIIGPTTTSAQKAATQVSIHKWVEANNTSILIIKSSMNPIMSGGIPEKENLRICLWSSSISLKGL